MKPANVRPTPFASWRPVFVALLTVGAVAGLARAESTDDAMYARVSFGSGGAMVKGFGDADWSYASVNTLILPGDTLWVDKTGTLEVEMSGGTFLRLADGSKAEVVAAPPEAAIRGWIGAFYVQRVRRSTGAMVFQTPVCSVEADQDTQARFDILSTGATTVSVRWGQATVRGDTGQPVLLQTGQRSYIDPGYLPSDPVPFDRAEEDAFDAWNRERSGCWQAAPTRSRRPWRSNRPRWGLPILPITGNGSTLTPTTTGARPPWLIMCRTATVIGALFPLAVTFGWAITPSVT